MKKTFILLLALLTLTACSDNAEQSTSAEATTQTAQATQSESTITSTVTAAETEAVPEDLDFPALGSFLYDITQQNFGVYIFDYNNDGADDALAYTTTTSGLSYYLINDVERPSLAYEFSASDEAALVFDSEKQKYAVYFSVFYGLNSNATHERSCFYIDDEMSIISLIHYMGTADKPEYTIEKNGEISVCTKDEWYAFYNEWNASLSDKEKDTQKIEKYTFCHMSVKDGIIIFDEMKDVQPQIPNEIVFSTYTFGEEYPALCGKKLIFTMISPEYSKENTGGYVGTVEIAVDGIASYSKEMQLATAFDVNVCDYNGDGNPEFTFAYSTSLKNDWNILSVSEDGTISECDINNGEYISNTISLPNQYDVSPMLTKSGDKSFCTSYYTGGEITAREMPLLTDKDIVEWFAAHPDKDMSDFYLKNTYTWNGSDFVISNQQIFDDREQIDYVYKQVSEGNEFIDFEMIDDYKGITNPEEVTPQLEAAMATLKKSVYYADSIQSYNNVSNTDKVTYYEADGTPIPQFSEAFVNDYDGDGSNETFVIINIAFHYGCVGNVLIFVDKNGCAEVLEAFHNGYSAQFLDYGKNKQLIIGTGGCLGVTSMNIIYGMRNGIACPLYGFRGSFEKENCFLSGFGWQSGGDFMYFDTVALEYRIIVGEEVDMNDIISMDKDGVLKDYYSDDEYEYAFVTLIGGKYYCMNYGFMDSGTIYTYENGKFVLQENSNVRYSFADDGSVIDIDIDKALAEMKK